MGQILHGSARTTEATRRAIQDSEESIAKLAKEHFQKTVKKSGVRGAIRYKTPHLI